MRIRNGFEGAGSGSGKIRKIGAGIHFSGVEKQKKNWGMHNMAAWPSGVWRTSGTVSNRRINDVTVG
jgi:hypothetical protein